MGWGEIRAGSVGLLVVGLVIGGAVVADAAHTKGARAVEPRPQRPDIVASFSNGTIVFDANGTVGSTSLKSGQVSLSTDDPYCVASPAAPCHYTINTIELVANDFTIKGTTIENVRAHNWYPAVGTVDDGTGVRLAVPPGMTFNVSGSVKSSPVVFTVTPQLPNVLSLVVDPVLQQVTLMGSLTGSQSGFTLKLTIHATSDAPFTNLPPLADAGPDQTVTTGCYALVSLDKSKTTDPNGDYSYGYFTEDGSSIGDGSKPVAMFPGLHRITLRAFDRQGGRGTDNVLIDVRDDGSVSPLPGATTYAVTAPQGVPIERVAAVAQTLLELKPNATIASATNAVSFGSATLAAGATVDSELWVPTPPNLGPNAKVTGMVHPTVSPLATIAWNVVVPPQPGNPVALGPKQTMVLAPGNYGDVALAPNATLTLRTGTYTASSLTTKPGAVLAIDDSAGPVYVFLRGALAHQGSVEGIGTAPATLLLAAHGTDISGPWEGTLLVPDGDAILGPPPNRDHRGAVFAGSVRLQSALIQAPFSWEEIRASRAACALRPKLVCVQKLGPASYVARFDYDNEVEFAGAFVPVGIGNRFSSGLENRGQPETFLAGLLATKGKGAFEVPFDGTPLSWTLGGRTATATSSSPGCP